MGVNPEYRTIALSIFLLLLSPIIVPIFNLDLAPLVYAVSGITGLILLSFGLVSFMSAQSGKEWRM